MDFLRKLFGKRQPPALSSEPPHPAVAQGKPVSSELEFFQYDAGSIPEAHGFCSDRQCPCDDTLIPKGSGYLYISQAAVANMKDMKAQKEGRADAIPIFGVLPILVCERGAKLRGIDLEVAADDAKRWWETGKAPLRPTPTA